MGEPCLGLVRQHSWVRGVLSQRPTFAAETVKAVGGLPTVRGVAWTAGERVDSVVRRVQGEGNRGQHGKERTARYAGSMHNRVQQSTARATQVAGYSRAAWTAVRSRG